jgi:hypothetical protein
MSGSRGRLPARLPILRPPKRSASVQRDGSEPHVGRRRAPVALENHHWADWFWFAGVGECDVEVPLLLPGGALEANMKHRQLFTRAEAQGEVDRSGDGQRPEVGVIGVVSPTAATGCTTLPTSCWVNGRCTTIESKDVGPWLRTR